MSLSRLFLMMANSRKQISGVGSDKIVINPRSSSSGTNHDPYAGEVVLCFDIDDKKAREKKVCQKLGIQEDDKKCDGIIFYSQDDSEDRVICLVEMKRTQVDNVSEQIISTKEHIKRLLQEDCGHHSNTLLQRIKWKACFYHSSSSPDEVANIKKKLISSGFNEAASFTVAHNDVGPFLRGEESAKALASRIRRKK